MARTTAWALLAGTPAVALMATVLVVTTGRDVVPPSARLPERRVPADDTPGEPPPVSPAMRRVTAPPSGEPQTTAAEESPGWPPALDVRQRTVAVVPPAERLDTDDARAERTWGMVPGPLRRLLRAAGVRVVLHDGDPVQHPFNEDLRALPRFAHAPGFHRRFGNTVYVDGTLPAPAFEVALLEALGGAADMWLGEIAVREELAVLLSPAERATPDARRESFRRGFAAWTLDPAALQERRPGLAAWFAELDRRIAEADRQLALTGGDRLAQWHALAREARDVPEVIR